MLNLLMLCALAAAPADKAPARSLEWPQFRGPNGDGHYQGAKLPLEWGPNKNVVWKTPIPGHGWSSPIVHDGKLYLTTAVPDGKKYSLRVVAVDSAEGKVLWNKEVFVEDANSVPQPHTKNSHASPTPVTDGESLFVHFGHMGTAALNLKGEILWTKPGMYAKHQHGNGGSPILVGDQLIFSCDGMDKQFVVALNKKTGEPIWKTDRKADAGLAFSFATPHLIDHKGTKQLISPASNLVAAYNPTTGAELWRIKFVGWSLIQRPIYGHGMVFLQTGYVTGAIHAVKPDGTGDVTKSHIAWTVRKGVPNTPSLLLVGEELYMFSDKGFASCLNAKTGETHWYERVPGEYSSSPIYHDGKIWITNEQGVGVVLQASKEFKMLTKSDLKERTFASIVPVDGSLYIRTETQLYRFQEK